MNQQAVIAATRHWISSLVIGLNLCPFAQRVFDAGRIRYVVSAAGDEETLLRELVHELQELARSPIATVETTLLIHPLALGKYLDYLDFLDVAERQLAALGLRGVIQLASFHPDYQFADTDPDAAENYTNRSPYPMLHLLREASITAVADDTQELLDIPRRNIEALRGLGNEKLKQQLKAIQEGPAKDSH